MKLVLACGGSGGHIFPAFSVAEELKKRDPAVQIIYACGKKDIENAIFRIVKNEKITPLESVPFRGSLSLLSPQFLLKSFQGFTQSVRFLNREKPDLVVGFGGYASFAVVLAAKLAGRRALIHEQNVVPGLTNRFLARIADGVALSFSETQSYLKKSSKSRVTGNPIRSFIERDCRDEALDFFSFSKEKLTVLVLGGSQGARSINAVFLESLQSYPETLKNNIQVLHLCGKLDQAGARAAYEKQGIPARCYSFFERMDLAYGAADLAIGRAGATFLAEINAKKIPALLIPYPYGNGHQKVNAEVFSRDQGAVVVEQQAFCADKIVEFILSHAQKTPLSSGGRTPDLRPNSRALLADFIEEKALGKKWNKSF